MVDKKILDQFEAQFDALKDVVNESNRRLVNEPVDEFFYRYQNVFIKSYLVNACSTLEAFIQDIAVEYLDVMSKRILEINVPYNAIVWSISKTSDEKIEKNFKYEPFLISKNKKDICDMVSANFYKTQKTFERLGVCLKNTNVELHKDFVSSIIEKRNKIVHHNDDASDVSFGDVIDIIEKFKKYASEIYGVVSASPHLQAGLGRHS